MKDSRLEAIFDAAMQKGSEAERVAYLEGACGSNADLRGRVETLLRAHDAAGGFLQATVTGRTEEGPGTTIGRYKLLQQIGEGGFGVVYMAEQLEPVRRKVALKIIKLGMDTRQVVARFESERQALALMDHPHIARVFDAGATESGRPYFVMELVKGISITDYADKNSLPMRERLELFVTVCQAVQHAHQKGIIHRDIKPSNVLVTLHDGKPVPKVIDFGIAKATSHRLTEKTVFTEFRQIIGTPQYMSPEQAEMSGLDVDTRCDIYSLGVLLYELLTSTTPIEAAWLQRLGYAEMQRVIREEEPPPPSLRISTLHEQLETVARHRNAEPKALSRQFRGDLDWIVMKALEKDRTRRYASAGDLAADVERYLKDEPVLAGPPSLGYKLRKFVRRNRTSVTAVVVVAVAMVAGLGLATAGFVSARGEAERSRKIASFLEEIVATVNPAEAEGREIDVEEVVARARKLFGNDHATVAAALDSLALQEQHAGKLSSAERLYRESARIWRNRQGEKDASLAVTLGHLGALLRLTGDDAGAEAAFREALQIAAPLPEGMQLAFCASRTELASLLQRSGRLEEAEQLVKESLRIRRLLPKTQQFRIAQELEQMTSILVSSGRIDEADRAFAEAIDLYRPLFPPDSPTAAFYNFGYGHWLRQHGRQEKAEPFLREAVRIYRKMERPPREYYLGAVDGLFQLIRWREESLDETIALFHECMFNMGQLLGADHRSLGPHFIGFAQILGERNRSAEAIPLLVEGLEIYRKSQATDWNPAPAFGALERHIRRLVLAPGLSEANYKTALAGARVLCDEQPGKAVPRQLKGIALYRLGRIDECLAELGDDTVETAIAGDERGIERLACLAMAKWRAGDHEGAVVDLAKVHELAGNLGKPPGKETAGLIAQAEALLDEKVVP